MFSVLIPVKGKSEVLSTVRARIKEIQETYPYLIGEILIEREGTLSEARKALAKKACFSFVLNLDSDTLIPISYLSVIAEILKHHTGIGAISADYYNKPQGHPAFGASVMPRPIMEHYYDWKSIGESGTCECLYMWEKLINEGYIVATVPLMVKHEK